MDKILKDGTIITKARFRRTTCKNCGIELEKSIIFAGGKFCGRKCRKAFKPRKKKRHTFCHNKIDDINDIDFHDMDHGSFVVGERD